MQTCLSDVGLLLSQNIGPGFDSLFPGSLVIKVYAMQDHRLKSLNPVDFSPLIWYILFMDIVE